ncbi:hypothetical protein NWP17_04500 [Chrysosporum bergii ANA360D]|uniref:Uncharacterized protein n=1 Tax=Chrysosporum bergii ANA360D TaxID=617107 RepID=A0AA43GQF2_9CYAN|nr:hypothetical protein [Chrysosporum bergii]MDH6059704.1 hypothetical protein [Chrysosporum bergii ANA360D]
MTPEELKKLEDTLWQSADTLRANSDLKSGVINDLYVCGQEKTLETVKLAKMNITVNGLRGEVKQANTYRWKRWFEQVDQLSVLNHEPQNDYQERLLEKYRQQGLEL